MAGKITAVRGEAGGDAHRITYRNRHCVGGLATTEKSGDRIGSGDRGRSDDFGIRCVIAPDFADIFYSNSFKNGILLIKLPQEDVDKLIEGAERGANATVTVDLENQEIKGPDGGVMSFDIDPFKKYCLLNGLDDIGLSLEKEDQILAFEEKHRAAQPWSY